MSVGILRILAGMILDTDDANVSRVCSSVADPKGAQPAPSPLPRLRVTNTENDHLSAEIWSRMRHLRPHISKFPSRAYVPAVVCIIFCKNLRPRLSIPGSATVHDATSPGPVTIKILYIMSFGLLA